MMEKKVEIDGVIYYFYGDNDKIINEIISYVEKKKIKNMKQKGEL